MYKHETKAWHRVVAFLLSFVLLFGMLPVNPVYAEELPGQEIEQGTEQPPEQDPEQDPEQEPEQDPEEGATELVATVEGITPGGVVAGSTITYTGLKLDWVAADTSIGRNENGWWVGIKIVMPEGVDLTVAKYGRVNGEKNTFAAEIVAEDGRQVMNQWVLVNETFAAKYDTINYSWAFDWDGDGDAEKDQIVKVSINTAGLTLMNGEDEVYPAPMGYGAVSSMLEDAENVLHVQAEEDGIADFSGKTLDWKPIDETKGRTKEGWWIGIRVDAPAGMDAAALENAVCRLNNKSETFRFLDELEEGGYLAVWFLVTPEKLEQTDYLINTCDIDWNGDGRFEQTVKAQVNPADVTLKKDGKIVYPLVTVTAKIEGYGKVLVDGQEVDDKGIQVGKGQEVTIEVIPEADTRITSLEIGGQIIQATGAYKSEFTFTTDAVIKVSFKTEYVISFVHNEHVTFTDELGNKLDPITVNPVNVIEDISFKIKATEDYAVDVLLVGPEGNVELDPDENGIYKLVANVIKGSCVITAVATDAASPVISDIKVSNANEWTTAKKITFVASDNSGKVTTYVSTVEYADAEALLNSSEQPVTSFEVTTHIAAGTSKTYYIYAVDEAGNMTVEAVEVEKIDRQVPNIELTLKETGLSKSTYTFDLSDADSGIDVNSIKVTYVWYDGKTYEVPKGDIKYEGNTLTVKVFTNGKYTIKVKDKAGNEYSSSLNEAGIDETSPTISGHDANLDTWYKDKYTITFSVDASQGEVVSQLLGVYYSTSEEFDEANVTEATLVEGNTYSITFDANGTYYIHAKDEGTKTGTVKVVIDHIDTTAPVVTLPEDISWTNEEISIKAKFHDAQTTGLKTGSEVVKLYWSTVGEDDAEPNEIDVTGKKEYEIPGPDGNFNGTYYVWVEDAVGRKSDVAEINVQRDVEKPVVSSAYFTNQYRELNKVDNITYLVYSGVVDVKINVSDAFGEIAKYEYLLSKANGEYEDWIAVDSPSFSIERKQFSGRVLVRVTDKAGNQSVVWNDNKQEPSAENKNCVAYHPDAVIGDGAKASYIILDKNQAGKPVVTIQTVVTEGVTEDYNGEWTNKNVLITMTSGDNTPLSGVAVYQYQILEGKQQQPVEDNWVDMVDGQLTIYKNTKAEYVFRMVSKSGVASKASDAYTIRLWNTNPAEPELTISEAKGENGWHVNVPTIRIEEIESPYPDDLIMYTSYTIYQQAKNEKGELQWTENGEPRWEKYQEYQEGEAEDSFSISDFPDGRYYIEVLTKDNAGNKTTTFFQVTETDAEETTEPATGVSKAKLEFNIDTTAPIDTELTITYTYEKMQEKKDENGETVLDENGNPVMEPARDEDGNIIMITDDLRAVNGKVEFNKFYKSAITIKLGGNFDVSGLAKMQYLIVPSLADYTPDSEESINFWQDYNEETGIVITPNEKFVLIFRAEDNAGNVEIITSTGIVVDDKDPSGDASDVVPEISYIAEKPNDDGFYVDENGFTTEVSVFDPKYAGKHSGADSFSGLAKITYIFYTKDGNRVNQVTGTLLDIQEEIQNGNVEAADDLIWNWQGNIVLDKDGIQKLNSNNVYLEIIAVDNAGNARITTSDVMKIDLTNPRININYDNNTCEEHANQDNVVINYFNADRIATITITERNFDSSRVIVKATKDEADFTVGDWKKIEGTGNGDNTQHVLVIEYKDDGDYTFTIEMTDGAGRGNDAITYGPYNDGDNTNTTDNVYAHAFTVDKTAPVINVSYDPNNPNQGKYFNEVRTATVVVTEHNFDRARTTITIGASLDGQAIQVPAWAFQPTGGDNWTATVVFEADGDYTFTATATDLAGNTDAGVNYGGSAAPTAFTIDKTIVAPSVEGVENGGSYTEEAEPSVDIHDINFEDYTLKLERTNEQGVNVDVTEELKHTITTDAQGLVVRYEDFPHEKEYDGVYTLTATITDKAGNSPEPTVIKFTVNRFGSIFLPQESLTNAEEGYHQSIDNHLAMKELNPNKLVEESMEVQITRDGKPVDVAGMVKIDTKTAGNEFGWYEYIYTLDKALFAEDGVYKITFLSVDSEGNECQSETYTFRVDKTAPELSSVVGLEEAIINAQEHEVRFTVFDAIGLKSIEIHYGNEVKTITDFEDPNNYNGSFILTESNDRQHVQIVIIDMAGNMTDTDLNTFTSVYEFNKDVTVSTNWAVRWFANKPLFFGSLAGAGGAGWLAWFLIFGKRKKKEEEKAV